MEFTDKVLFEKQREDDGIKSSIIVTLRKWSEKWGHNVNDVLIKHTTVLEEGVQYTDTIALLPEDAKLLAQAILEAARDIKD